LLKKGICKNKKPLIKENVKHSSSSKSKEDPENDKIKDSTLPESEMIPDDESEGLTLHQYAERGLLKELFGNICLPPREQLGIETKE
jgi:hypothetical protein